MSREGHDKKTIIEQKSERKNTQEKNRQIGNPEAGESLSRGTQEEVGSQWKEQIRDLSYLRDSEVSTILDTSMNTFNLPNKATKRALR